MAINTEAGTKCPFCLPQYFSRTDRVLKHRRMCHERERKAHKAAAAGKTGPPRDADNPSLSFPAKESSAPKKKRQKCSGGDKAPGSSSVSSTAAQVELQVLSVLAADDDDDDEEKEEEEERRRGKIESLPLYAVTSKVKTRVRHRRLLRGAPRRTGEPPDAGE